MTDRAGRRKKGKFTCSSIKFRSRAGVTRRGVRSSRKRALFVARRSPFAVHYSPLTVWPDFMLMSGKLSEKRLPDVAGYHTTLEVGRTSHSLPPSGFPRSPSLAIASVLLSLFAA